MIARSLPILAITMHLLSSCDKESNTIDPILVGTWQVTHVSGQQYVNGNAGWYLEDQGPSGFVRFDSDGTGEQDYMFTIGSADYTFKDEFVWEASGSEILVKRFNQPDLVWRRSIKENSRQQATYAIVVNSNQHWDYTLTLER